MFEYGVLGFVLGVGVVLLYLYIRENKFRKLGRIKLEEFKHGTRPKEGERTSEEIYPEDGRTTTDEAVVDEPRRDELPSDSSSSGDE